MSAELHETEGLGNADVLLRFYEKKPTAEIMTLQKAAVFNLLSLAHTAIFTFVLREAERSGRVSLAGLRSCICASRPFGKKWSVPFSEVGRKVDSARDLEQALFEAEAHSAGRAAIGGILLARTCADPAFAFVHREISDTPVVALLQHTPPNATLTDSWMGLVAAMIERHNLVSLGKNRQRWCYLEGDDVVKDDPREIGMGWHSMRFPQLISLCRDLRLTKEDLANEG